MAFVSFVISLTTFLYMVLGDMQLTRDEINATHLIVTTPEKWDVVTRKSSGEEALVSVCTPYGFSDLTPEKNSTSFLF